MDILQTVGNTPLVRLRKKVVILIATGIMLTSCAHAGRAGPPPLSLVLGKDHKELRAMAEQMTAEWQAIADSSAGSTDAQDRSRSAFLHPS